MHLGRAFVRQRDGDALAPHVVQVDPRLTSAALAHLLENAAQYAPTGTAITITARVDADALTLAVADQGPGVASEDLPALYAGAACFVFPSIYEGFGLPVLEAMASGAPVVCSNASSLPEVAGDAALMVKPDDAGAFAGAVERVLADGDLRSELRARGLRRAAQFTWDRAAQQTMEVYADVLRAVPGR